MTSTSSPYPWLDPAPKWCQRLGKQPLMIDRLRAVDRASLIAQGWHYQQTTSHDPASLLVVSPDSEAQSQLLSELPFFLPSTPLRVLASWETLPSEPVSPTLDVIGARLLVLSQLMRPGPVLLFVTCQALQQRVPSPAQLLSSLIHLRQGQTLGLHALTAYLLQQGYQEVDQVRERGQFARRSSRLDLFPVGMLHPLRIEWWGDLVESLRIFDTASQRSCVVPGVSETLEQEGTLVLPTHEEGALTHPASIGDYLQNYIAWIDLWEEVEDRYVELDRFIGAQTPRYRLFRDAWATPESRCVYTSQRPLNELTPMVAHPQRGEVACQVWGHECIAHHIHLAAGSVTERFPPLRLDLPPFFAAVDEALTQGYHVYLLYASEAEHSAALKYLPQPLATHPHLHLLSGYLSSSMVIDECHLVLAPMAEFNGHQRLYRPINRLHHSTVSREESDLEPGERVVHLQHGVGIFRGFEKDPRCPTAEMMRIEYAGQASILVPLDQAGLVTRFEGLDQSNLIHQLGSKRWKKQLENAQEAIEGYAQQLLELYASRQLDTTATCPAIDSQAVVEFEQDFPYPLTQDQILAIEAIKQDLTGSSPMDRLLCGDVGYGKTEVAMRAAFKMILDAKQQVAVLVPTTLLALQHAETFKKRMHGFPVRIGALSRMNSKKERDTLLRQLQQGEIDLLIGTHQLLGSQVHFRQLGLLIIDEEQRFGLKAKEHLKLLKSNVHVLTLSATPLPRTLHLALMGGKQLSTLASPPHDRQPVTTVVAQRSDDLIQGALLREMHRRGQAIYILNDVEGLPLMAAHLATLLPHLRLAIVHGQLPSEEIERVFQEFQQHKVDILLATSIVETGIDIPNANTLIVDHAHDFGLADLYQLRGRVGRWNRRAFAYLLYPKEALLTPLARKRLETIATTSSQGGGMHVALQDLALRGFGQLIGQEQSGHLSTIGFHLYCRLLQQSVNKLKKKGIDDGLLLTIPEHNLPIEIPVEYLPARSLRMELYRRVSEVADLAQVAALGEEVLDRFGPLPEPLLALLLLARLRLLAHEHHATLLKVHYDRRSGEIKVELRMLSQKPVSLSQKLPETHSPSLVKLPLEAVEHTVLTLVKRATAASASQQTALLKATSQKQLRQWQQGIMPAHLSKQEQ